MYINYILYIDKETFAQHLDQLKVIFQRFKKTELKVNVPKCSFGLKKIPYLGYIISIDGIKPDPKKVQGIIDITKLKTAKDIKSFIGIVQFYRDIWKRRFHFLFPLIDSAAGKKGRMTMVWTPVIDEVFIQVKQMVS